MRAVLVAVLVALAALAWGGPLPEGVKLRPGSVRVHPVPQTLGAFPGCQGAGCNTRGGFTSPGTPTVYRVTSLASGSGAGTLGACVDASGPRICVFAVAGEIVGGSYNVMNPYITIRGDTAPGKGISITRNNVSSALVLAVRTHDVVVRGLRFRGGGTGGPSSNATCVTFSPSSTLGNAVNNIVFDHNSVNWGQGENFSIYSRQNSLSTDQPHDITLSYNMIIEGLMQPEGYSKTALIAGDSIGQTGTHVPSHADEMTDIDMHHNYWGNSKRRCPELRLKSARYVNNVLYNWATGPVNIYGAMAFDFIGNIGKQGPNTTATAILNGLGYWYNYDGHDAVNGDQTVHVSGNKMAGGSVQGWGTSLINVTSAAVCNGTTVLTSCRPSTWPVHRDSPMAAAATGPAITATSADAAATAVLGAGGAGHSRRLDCGGAWVTTGVRDSQEDRLITSYSTPPSYFAFSGCSGDACWPTTAIDASGGNATNNGFPVIPVVSSTCSATSRNNTSCACADSDADGIPDYWEKTFCGSATACSPFATTVAPPWTNLEAYMSGLVVAP